MKSQVTSLPALSCFRVAADFESFSKAADHLNITHGAVSRAVRLLEDDLGTALFERRNRAVFLTDTGRRLAHVVARGLRDIEDEVRAIKAEGARAAITVSCEPSLMMRWLIARMPEFYDAHPDTEVRLVAGGGPVSLGAGIDLAIRRNDFSWPKTYWARALFDERIGPVCSPNAAETFFTSNDLRPSAPLLHTRTRPSAWADWQGRTGAHLPPNTGQYFEHFFYSLQAACAGLGVAIGPWHLVQNDIRDGLLVAPQGFCEDGSTYHLLGAKSPKPGSLQADFGEWLAGLSTPARTTHAPT